jgi:hypothetical protein
VQDGHAGGDRERVAADQPGEDGRRRGECGLRGPAREDDGQDAQQDGGGDEAEAGADRLPEVVRRERRVDPGADRAGEDHGVPAQLCGAHERITVRTNDLGRSLIQLP